MGAATSTSGGRTDQDNGGPTPEKPTRPEPKRINVAVTPDTIRALERVIERESVTLTEALRRLIGYGEFVYRAIKEDDAKVFMHQPDGTIKEIVLI